MPGGMRGPGILPSRGPGHERPALATAIRKNFGMKFPPTRALESNQEPRPHFPGLALPD